MHMATRVKRLRPGVALLAHHGTCLVHFRAGRGIWTGREGEARPPRTKALEVAGVASAVCSGINVAVQREPVGLALRVVIGGAHRLACLVGHLSGARRIGGPRDRRSCVFTRARSGYNCSGTVLACFYGTQGQGRTGAGTSRPTATLIVCIATVTRCCNTRIRVPWDRMYSAASAAEAVVVPVRKAALLGAVPSLSLDNDGFAGAPRRMYRQHTRAGDLIRGIERPGAAGHDAGLPVPHGIPRGAQLGAGRARHEPGALGAKSRATVRERSTGVGRAHQVGPVPLRVARSATRVYLRAGVSRRAAHRACA